MVSTSPPPIAYPGEAGVEAHDLLALDPVHHVEVAHLVLHRCPNVCDPACHKKRYLLQ
jgi:hypothetical protein